MIDNAAFYIDRFSNNEFDLLTDRLDVNCNYNHNQNRKWFDFVNLRIKYFPNEQVLRIQNSMHKYYNAVLGDLKQYVNHNDFTFFDFKLVCEDWSKHVFERPLKDFKLSTNFEVGINIELEYYKPFDVLTRYMSYVTTTSNEFYTCPPQNLKGKPIQRMCYLSDYKIKGYDKSKQSKIALNVDLLRYEIVYTELRKIRKALGLPKTANINLLTLSEKHTWDMLFSDILKVYDAIKKIPLIPDEYPLTDINKVHSYCNKIMAADIKRNMNINTYNKLRASYKKVYNDYNRLPTNYHQIVRQKLINKYNSLIN